MHIYKIIVCSMFVSIFTYTMEKKNTIKNISSKSTLEDVQEKWNLSNNVYIDTMSLGSFYLFNACNENNYELVKDLLCIGQDSDPCDDLDHTPLHYSMTPGKMSPEIAALLIKHGANYKYKRENFENEQSIIDSWKPDYKAEVFMLVRYTNRYNYIKQRELK